MPEVTIRFYPPQPESAPYRPGLQRAFVDDYLVDLEASLTARHGPLARLRRELGTESGTLAKSLQVRQRPGYVEVGFYDPKASHVRFRRAVRPGWGSGVRTPDALLRELARSPEMAFRRELATTFAEFAQFVFPPSPAFHVAAPPSTRLMIAEAAFRALGSYLRALNVLAG